MSKLPPFARAWLKQRDDGALAIKAIEERELAALGPDEALRLSDALLAACSGDQLEERRASSGFVVQQQLFARARR